MGGSSGTGARRSRRARAAVAAVAVGCTALVGSAPALASSVDGCSGSVESFSADGELIDAASAADGVVTDTIDGGTAFTAKNPFVVDNEGVVTYSGKTDAVIVDHEWSVSMLGLEIASGGSANVDRVQEDSGEYDLGEDLPVKVTGLVKVDGALAGTGGECTGDGYVKIQGNPFASPVTWAGLSFAGLGAVGVFLSLPRVRPLKGGA